MTDRMTDSEYLELDRREIRRYLGYGPKDAADEVTDRLLEEETERLLRVMRPKRVYRAFPIEALGEDCVDFGFARVESRNLARNLNGCGEAVFLAATLGREAERLLQRYGRLEISRAAVLSAAAAEAIEKYCDACEREICETIARGRHLKPRFSPGYGDFPLEFQRTLLDVLGAQRQIGLTLTDALLMLPTKSVTAVIGVSREPAEERRRGCGVCGKADCLYRRE